MTAPEQITCGEIRLLLRERIAFARDTRLDLTAREFDVLVRLGSHPGWVFTTEQLADSDEASPDFSPESVCVHVSHIRHKLADAGMRDVIQTVRGVGYRLCGDPGTPNGPGSTGMDDCREGGAAAEATRRLHEAFWRLEEAAILLDHAGTDDQVTEVTSAFGALAERIRAMLRPA